MIRVGLALVVLASCAAAPASSSTPSSAECGELDGPSSPSACMDACKPDGLHLYRPCYNACTEHAEARDRYRRAAADWAAARSKP